MTGERGLGTPPYTSLARANDAQERLYRWATAFRSIGDVIHLLQDGAQPQHVRNDPHSPFTSGERQAYEGYTNARVVGAGVAKVNAYVNEFFSPPQQAPLPVIVTSRYPAVMFSTPLRFFTTRLKTDGPTVPPDNRYGLMDYTNRGFFTGGTLPGSPGNTFLEPSSTIDSFYTAISQPCVAAASIANTLTNLTCKHLMHNVLDSVAAPPAYTDTLPAEFTKPPLLLQSAFSAVAPGNPIPRPHNGYSVGLEEFQTMANLTIPRAISYSAGLIDYFFRGQLAVTAPTNKVAAVLNQGVQHTMNAQGYPCMGTATTDGCALFGFVSIRVSVQNTTAQITESGTGTVVAQNLSTTLANPGPTDPQLVAVARYHRNTCYTPVLTGERVQAYSGTITEPVCSSGQTVRTLYQEISVSKPAVATAAQLVSGATPFEVHFDFSADPIPVNATDLFIQVVYRGPMGDPVLGQEQDAIAVGTLDVREPTFVAFWNNTDYFWNGTIWQSDGITYHNEGIESFWACAGPSSLNLALMYQYTGAPGFPAMVDPVVSPGDPGMVRLAFVFPPPDSSGLRKIVQGTPEQYPGGDLRIPIESAASAGQFRQANLENISAATLTQPSATCGTSLPTTAQYWCFDPIKKRRNQLFGALAIPLYLFTSGANDVDSAVPAMSQFTGTIPLQGGTVSFDTGATLGACPVQ